MDARKKKLLTIAIAIILLLSGIIGYRIYVNQTAAKDRAARATQGRGTTVETALVGRQDIQPVLGFSAGLDPVWSAEISSKVDGRIDRLQVEEGDFVKAGMVLAMLDTNELAAQVTQAQGNLYTSQAALEQAKIDLVRSEALAKQGAISQASLDSARIKRDSALGAVKSAEGNLALLQAKLDNANITAPRSGVIVKRNVQSGYYTKAGSAIVTLADVTSLLAKATVGEGQIGELTVGSVVTIKVAALGDKSFTGKITRLSPAATLPSRTFTAEVTIPNQDGMLKSGMFAKVEVPGQVHKNALVVPEGALVMREDQKTVYVVTADGKAQQRVLKLGYVGGGWAEVLEGLNEGDKIVVSGQNKLKDGAAVAGAGDK